MKSGRKIIKLANDISPAFEEESIHKVRTTIKKMRAIGDWAGIPVKNFFKKDYRILGKIRDVQLVLSKINHRDYNVPVLFRDWLEGNLNQMKDEWKKKYRHKKGKRQLDKLENMVKKAKGHNKKHSLKFEKHKEQTLTPFMHDRPLSDEGIHSGRKIIKEIDFLNKWQKSESDVQLKKVSDETGEYMDTINAIRLFEQYISEQTDASKINESESILAGWKADKEQHRIHLLKSIDSLPA